jgi:hypothetical protein
VGEPLASFTVTVVEKDAPCSILISANPAILVLLGGIHIMFYLCYQKPQAIKNPAEAGSLK